MRRARHLRSGILRTLPAWLSLLAWLPAHADVSPFAGFWKLVKREAAAPPALSAAAAAERSKLQTRDDIDVQAVRWCVMQGLPYITDNAGPIDIIVGAQEVAILAEKLALPRHIYTAGQPRPDMNIYDPTPVGYSSGQWHGQNELLVDTVGLSAGVGPASVPRTTTSHLVETFKVSGPTLTVSAVWTDSAMLHRPYRYTLTYRRLPERYNAEESYCDPRVNGVGHR